MMFFVVKDMNTTKCIGNPHSETARGISEHPFIIAAKAQGASAVPSPKDG